MIAFACPSCGLKLKVKPEHAGRSSKCPTCKQPITIPVPDPTQAYVPPDRIDGAHSSVADAGLGGGVTLDERKGDGNQKSVRDVLARGSAQSGRATRRAAAPPLASRPHGGDLRRASCPWPDSCPLKSALLAGAALPDVTPRHAGAVRRTGSHFIVFGEGHLRHLVTQYLAFYHAERPHQGDGNVPLSQWAARGTSRHAVRR